MLRKYDIVQTPSGRQGYIEIPPGGDNYPDRALVFFPTQNDRRGDRIWLLASILTKVEAENG